MATLLFQPRPFTMSVSLALGWRRRLLAVLQSHRGCSSDRDAGTAPARGGLALSEAVGAEPPSSCHHGHGHRSPRRDLLRSLWPDMCLLFGCVYSSLLLASEPRGPPLSSIPSFLHSRAHRSHLINNKKQPRYLTFHYSCPPRLPASLYDRPLIRVDVCNDDFNCLKQFCAAAVTGGR